jgi:hypothetical protein
MKARDASTSPASRRKAHRHGGEVSPQLAAKPSSKAGEVGYCKPPHEHAWKPGQSGNPRGRAKGSKNESTILREILARKIESRSAGRSRKISVVEGILLRITEDALKGNTKSATFLLNRYAAMVSGELRSQDLNADDREVLEAFAERLKQGHKGHPNHNE